MSVASKLTATLEQYDPAGTGNISRTNLYRALHALDQLTWTAPTLDRLLQEAGVLDNDCVRYRRFVAWVMEVPSAAGVLESDEDLMASIRLASSQGPRTFLSVQPDPLTEAEILNDTLESDPPTELPTRRPSSCPTESLNLEDPKGDLLATITSGEEALMATIQLAASQGPDTLASPVVHSSIQVGSELDVLHAALA
eukprot:gb/GFBE01005071.1/.p1 GENE.gb/GFBE01005071.1/~~gb/GFBE01005071.1/.p1  ORF type:complete len:197 (+),score=22.49 gb/GFBE01005071.1/:1-591(+)